uniref:Uncharacterized protein n=1 Tax=Physcomitrium patens TaxID=3218 RepID=A0A2K1KWM5_PHYPA|nr:hypothetical protein PHYPA_005192 [Physcomitrium patens]
MTFESGLKGPWNELLEYGRVPLKPVTESSRNRNNTAFATSRGVKGLFGSRAFFAILSLICSKYVWGPNPAIWLAVLPVQTIAPLLTDFIARVACFMPTTAPRKLTAKVSSKSSRLSSSMDPNAPTNPALLKLFLNDGSMHFKLEFFSQTGGIPRERGYPVALSDIISVFNPPPLIRKLIAHTTNLAPTSIQQTNNHWLNIILRADHSQRILNKFHDTIKIFKYPGQTDKDGVRNRQTPTAHLNYRSQSQVVYQEAGTAIGGRSLKGLGGAVPTLNAEVLLRSQNANGKECFDSSNSRPSYTDSKIQDGSCQRNSRIRESKNSKE